MGLREHEYTKDDAIAIADGVERGFLVVTGNSYLLTVDLDRGKELNQDVLVVLHEMTGVIAMRTWVSKSGKGHHVTIHTEKAFTLEERAAIQAALGSDPIREIVGLKRWREGRRNEPFILYKPTSTSNKNGNSDNVPLDEE